MCGRFALASLEKEIIEEFDISEPVSNYRQSYNIAPSQDIVVMKESGKLVAMRWGLVPHWAKDEKIGYKMINARAESITEKPSFRKPFAKQRCLILASGFYEWKKDGKNKTPYYIHLKDNKPFSFAGIYDTWAMGGKTVVSCTIITTSPNALMKKIHDRMPVIVARKDRRAWLEDSEHAKELLETFPEKDLDVYEVSSLVNSPRNNSPECINRINL